MVIHSHKAENLFDTDSDFTYKRELMKEQIL